MVQSNLSGIASAFQVHCLFASLHSPCTVFINVANAFEMFGGKKVNMPMLTITQGIVAIFYESQYLEEMGYCADFHLLFIFLKTGSICKHLGGDSIINVQN